MADPTAELFRSRLAASAAEAPFTTRDDLASRLGIDPSVGVWAQQLSDELKPLLLRQQATSFEPDDLRTLARTFALERAAGISDQHWDRVFLQIAGCLTAGSAIVPPGDAAWDRALLIGRALVFLDYLPNIPDARIVNASAAAARLHNANYAFVAGDGALHFSPGDLERVTNDLYERIKCFGAIEALRRLLQGVRDAEGFAYDQYLIARKYSTYPPTSPAVPVGFLLNLAARAPAVGSDQTASNSDWTALIERATDIAAILGAQTVSVFTLINVSPSRLEENLRRLSLGDHLFGLRQWPLPFTKRMLAAFFATESAGMKIALGWDQSDVIALCTVLEAQSGSDPVVLPRHALVSAVPAGVAEKLLPHFIHDAATVNAGYDAPTAATKSDLMLKPMIAIDPDHVYIPARSCAGPAIYEAAMTAYRKSAPANLVGDGAERVVDDLFRGAGLIPSVAATKYAPGPDGDGECDLVFESDAEILFVECKAKALTRAAMAGAPMQALLDFLPSVLKAQAQALRHERILRARGAISFEGGQRIDWNGRHIVRLSISHLELGALQDRMVFWQLIRPLLAIGLQYDPAHQRAKSFTELQAALDEFRSEYVQLHALGVDITKPGSAASLSAGQLAVFLEDRPTLSDLVARIAPYITFMSLNPIYELHLQRQATH